MADDLRLYFFECGHLKTYTQFIKMNEGMNDSFEAPVPFFLITPPRGNVLFDGGNALEVAEDATAHWGEAVVEIYEPHMTEDEFVVNQLQNMDVDPASVRYVVQSHLHLDHSGAVGHFPNAEYVVQRRELEYAYTPDWFQKPAYIRSDFDRDVNWLFLDGEHDACYTMDHYNNEALPGLIHSAHDVAASVQKIHRAVDAVGAMVVTGHDPDEWPNFKKAPEYYS